MVLILGSIIVLFIVAVDSNQIMQRISFEEKIITPPPGPGIQKLLCFYQ